MIHVATKRLRFGRDVPSHGNLLRGRKGAQPTQAGIGGLGRKRERSEGKAYLIPSTGHFVSLIGSFVT